MFLVTALGIVAAVLFAAGWALRPLRAAELPVDAGALVLEARDGTPLGTVLGRGDRHTFAVPLARIAPSFLAALVAVEDARFFAHGAIDPLATLRAAALSLPRGEAPAGASTIAMQLARTLERMPPGLAGKLAESVLAARLERGMTKAEILEAYANRAPMGANLYGVEAAARTYLGIPAAQLDLAQSALLAALPNAPSRLDPYRHAGRLHERARFVLARMRALGSIDAETERAAASEEPALRPPDAALTAAQFCFFQAARTPPGIARVRTTIDPELQRFVEVQLRTVVGALAAHDVRQAAALVVDNRTAEVLAYAGSIGYDDDAEGRNDGVRALRQPGSALKPFLYELAFERRAIRPYTILPDVPTSYAIPGAELYVPVDYSQRFLGPVRARIALADSLNVPAVRVLERTGVPVFLDRLHALGFGHLDRDAAYYGLGLTLGGGEVSLWELARAYTALASDGVVRDLVTTRDAPSRAAPWSPPGAASFAHRPEWAEVAGILADRHARAASFGVDSILALPYDAAVKTGTSSDYRDTWTAGFTRAYTVAVWVGNFDGHAMRGVSGVTGAGPIWSRIVRRLHERREPAALAPPHGWQRRAICTTEPRFAGSDCTPAEEWLDRGDIGSLAFATARKPRPGLGPEYDAWLAAQPLAVRSAGGARILSPREGDVFVAPPRSGERIDVLVASADAAHAELRLDGRRVLRQAGVFVVPLALGSHELTLLAREGVVRTHYVVIARGPRGRAGFTLTRAPL